MILVSRESYQLQTTKNDEEFEKQRKTSPFFFPLFPKFGDRPQPEIPMQILDLPLTKVVFGSINLTSSILGFHQKFSFVLSQSLEFREF